MIYHLQESVGKCSLRNPSTAIDSRDWEKDCSIKTQQNNKLNVGYSFCKWSSLIWYVQIEFVVNWERNDNMVKKDCVEIAYMQMHQCC